jgi:hypothetical protein
MIRVDSHTNVYSVQAVISSGNLAIISKRAETDQLTPFIPHGMEAVLRVKYVVYGFLITVQVIDIIWRLVFIVLSSVLILPCFWVEITE